MPATVKISSYHGVSGGTSNDVDSTTINYKLADNDTNDANTPVVIPASGTVYSYIKQFRFRAQTSPANTINNLKVYSDGGNGLGTGVDLLVATASSYADPLANADTPLAGPPPSIFTMTSGSPLAVTGSINNPSTGAFGDYIVTQLSVASTAIQGNSGTETLVFSFDES